MSPRGRRCSAARRPCGSPRPRVRRRSSTRSRATVHSVTLNGVALDPAEVSDGVRIQLPNLAAENELVVVADGRYMNTGEGLHRFVDPVDGEVYLYTAVRGARLAPHVRRVRAARPEGRRSSSPSPRRRTGRSSRTPPTPEPAPAPRDERDGHVGVRAHPAHLELHHRAHRRPLRRRARRAHERRRPGHPARRVQPQEPLAVPRRRLHLREDEAGLRVLRGEVRRALPVREVRPALRARVQRGRDGERGRGDLHRDLRVPLEGHRRRSRSAGSSRSCTSSRTCGSATSSP